MKKFIRNLSINERKLFHNILYFEVFSVISAFLVKYVFIGLFNFGIYTIIAEVGALISINSFLKIIILIRRDKTKREDYLDIHKLYSKLVISIFNLINFVLLIYAITQCKISSFYMILRISTFFSVLFNFVIFKENIYIFQILYGVAQIILIIIVFNSRTEDFNGLVCSIIYALNASLCEVMSKHLNTSKVEIINFLTGLVCSVIGGFIMIINGEDLEYYNINAWVIIIFMALIYYYILYLQNRFMQSKFTNKFLSFFFIDIFVSILIGFVFFKEDVSFIIAVTVFCNFLISIFYSNKVADILKKSNEQPLELRMIDDRVEK